MRFKYWCAFSNRFDFCKGQFDVRYTKIIRPILIDNFIAWWLSAPCTEMNSRLIFTAIFQLMDCPRLIWLRSNTKTARWWCMRLGSTCFSKELFVLSLCPLKPKWFTGFWSRNNCCPKRRLYTRTPFTDIGNNGFPRYQKDRQLLSYSESDWAVNHFFGGRVWLWETINYLQWPRLYQNYSYLFRW